MHHSELYCLPFSPTGRRFKSRKDILDYYEKIDESVDIERLSFSKTGHEKYLAKAFSKMARGSLSDSRLRRPAAQFTSPVKRSHTHPRAIRNFLKAPLRIALKGSFGAFRGRIKGSNVPAPNPQQPTLHQEHQRTSSSHRKPTSPAKVFSTNRSVDATVASPCEDHLDVQIPTENGTAGCDENNDKSFLRDADEANGIAVQDNLSNSEETGQLHSEPKEQKSVLETGCKTNGC